MNADSNPLTHFSQALSSLVAAAAPSVVTVHSHRATSSGFVWKPGLIVTADEALAGDGDIAVTFAGARRVTATSGGRDPTTDVALLRADTGDALPIVLAETVPASGALAISVGGGIGSPVAALGMVASSGPAWRSMRGGEIDARIELDLSLRRRAEGGVALDAQGQVFGMVVFGPRRSVLAIPGATVARVAAQLDAHGRIARGYLGLGLHSVRLDRSGGMGAMVMSVEADGPGARAGVRQGDILQAWDGQPIGPVNALLRALGPASVGRTVALSLRRGGEARDVVLTVGERP